MSEQKLPSPLLDGFLMGDPISSHDGVRCCPAMREESDEKYIVKIISVPSSQKQLDALLLTGAYPDAASALEYFKEQAEGIVKEAELLKKLSKLQGFVPYENWQIVPMEKDQLGYEVYLLSPYRHTLEKYLAGHTMTHLGAVNLGLDLCAALSICRRAGYIFVDLKPSNIFLTNDREYRIGGLGFAGLDSLRFNSLPSKYCSPYTAQELHDPLATLNPTADIYAVGMILYQIYNNGQLPFDEKAPAAALPTPLNADYELAEIIQKAIDPNPRKRWQTPIEMGQALVGYMQRNQVGDTPIVPPAADHDAEEITPPAAPEADSGILKGLTADETAPDTDSGDDLVEAEMTEEVSSMLAQADELLAGQVPAPVVVPETPEIKMPELTADDTEASSEIPEEAEPAPEEIPGVTDPSDDSDPNEDTDFIVTEKPKIKKSWIRNAVVLILLALLGYGGIRFYNDYYLIPIGGMEVDGKEDMISVFLRTEADETLLTVVCTDTYGNTMTMPVVDGLAEFIGLNPDTMYRITVEAEGFHAVSGITPFSYTTAEQTKITGFSAKTGTEDGSVILSFAVDGRDAQDWTIDYAAAGEEPRSISFTGHTVTVTGLSVGSTYTFTLTDPTGELWMVGGTDLEYTASQIVIAENLAITGCADSILTAQWNVPEGAVVESWTVRCYADAGFDETITVTEPHAEFHGIEANKAYTVEVTAAGMTQNARAYITANPTTITKLSVEAPSDGHSLNISWEFSGTAPEGGWLLLYAADGSDNQAVIPCEEPSAVIENRIPGVTYDLTIQPADGSTVFKGSTTYECLDTEPFDQLSVSKKTVQASLCPTPDKENWTYKDVDDDDYTSKYAPGSKASLVIYSPDRPDYSQEEFHVMFVIRDAEGNVLLDLVKDTTATWSALWNDRSRYCELDIPAIPSRPGKYTVEVYFNSQLLVEKSLTILDAE